ADRRQGVHAHDAQRRGLRGRAGAPGREGLLQPVLTPVAIPSAGPRGGAGRFQRMRVGLIGSGNMARAMARGWGDPVLCSDGGSGRAQALADELGGRAASNAEVAAEADLVILCHKPYQLNHVAAEIADEVKVAVSVLGGVTSATVRAAYPNAQ